MRKIPLLLAAGIAMSLVNCQKSTDTITPTTTTTTTTAVRYKEATFTATTTTSDVQYGSNVTVGGTTKVLKLDIYAPDGDTESKRPLLILVPGGGFASMTDKSSFTDEAKAMAKYGYVVATINYRTYDGTATISNKVLKQLILQGMQDAKAAIRFFRKDAATTNTYKINPDKIFLGGHSAGGMVAAHTVYLDDLTKADTEFQTVISANGGLEGNSGNSGYLSVVSGCINLSGALLDKNYLTATAKPMLGEYGTADNLVPYNDGTFSLPTITGISMSGTNALHTKATALGVSSTIYAISGGDHFATANATCADCQQQMAAFMYKLL